MEPKFFFRIIDYDKINFVKLLNCFSIESIQPSQNKGKNQFKKNDKALVQKFSFLPDTDDKENIFQKRNPLSNRSNVDTTSVDTYQNEIATDYHLALTDCPACGKLSTQSCTHHDETFEDNMFY